MGRYRLPRHAPDEQRRDSATPPTAAIATVNRLPPAADAVIRMQREAGNGAVLRMLQRWDLNTLPLAAAKAAQNAPKCALGSPAACSTYGDWIATFPDAKGPGKVNVTNDPNVPADLRALIAGKIGGGLPDCADIAFVLRHYWLKAQGKSFTFKGGKSDEFTLGKGASDKEVRVCMINAGTGNFQEERKKYALVDYYKKKGARITDFEELIAAGLKKGDLFVWQRKAGIVGNFSGHVQTIQSLDVKNKTMTIVQGNMKDGKGVGELQQVQMTFSELTGNSAGKGEVQSNDEEDFYGAGPWKG